MTTRAETIPAAAAAGGVEATAPRAMNAGPAALVRDVILGGQDGLVNVLGLVLGMAAATSNAHVVVAAGLAALLAESIAMAGVAFTSTAAERQLSRGTRGQLQAERESLRIARRAMRRAELEERGASPDVAALVEAAATEESVAWVDRLEHERTMLSPVRETRPIRAGLVVGISTAIGSSVPLLPFVLLPIGTAPFVALGLAGLVLGGAGLERAELAGGSHRRAALEMIAIGIVSALAGYLIGQVLRVPVG
jgi:VIT1/CCC1 family predicted Fe2+/Mn2+ transporter